MDELKDLFFRLCVGETPELKKFLSEHEDFDVTVTDRHGTNGLMIAAESKRINTVKLLLRLGVDPSIQDNRNQSVLEYALRAPNNNKVILELVKTGIYIKLSQAARIKSLETLREINKIVPLYLITNSTGANIADKIIRSNNTNRVFYLLKTFPELIYKSARNIIGLLFYAMKNTAIELIPHIHNIDYVEKLFISFINGGNLDEIKRFYEKYHPDVTKDVIFSDEITNPLTSTLGLLKKSKSIVDYLISLGADPNRSYYGEESTYIKKITYDLDNCNVDIVERIGGGSFGHIFKINKDGQTVALKIQNTYDNNRGIDNVIEIDIMFTFSHPHVMNGLDLITPHDCSINGSAIIMPLAEFSFLRYFPGEEQERMIFYKIATGLDFLNSQRIVHLDIKDDNIVIDSSMNPRIIDFGLSRYLLEDTCSTDTELVTPIYRPPELFPGEDCLISIKSDVWSYGCMLLYHYIHMDNPEEIFGQHLSINNTENFLWSLNRKTLEKFVYHTERREKLIDLLTKIFVKYKKRYTMEQVLDHPFFEAIDYKVSGSIKRDPVREIEFNFDELEQLAINMETYTFFLFIDIYVRFKAKLDKRGEESSPLDDKVALILAVRLSEPEHINKRIIQFINTLRIFPQIDEVFDRECYMISTLNGRLSVMTIYNLCNNSQQLKYFVNHLRKGRRYDFSREQLKIFKSYEYKYRTPIPMMYKDFLGKQ